MKSSKTGGVCGRNRSVNACNFMRMCVGLESITAIEILITIYGSRLNILGSFAFYSALHKLVLHD